MIGFLSNVIDTVGKFAGPAADLYGVYQAFKPAPRPQTPPAEAYAMRLLKAISEPGNPQMKALAAEEFQNMMGGLQSDIRAKTLADRREAAMGRAPVYFDPERFDEQRAFLTSRAGPGMAQMAREAAINRLLKSAGGVDDYAELQYGRSRDYMAKVAQKEKQRSNALDLILKSIKGQEPVRISDITWNTPSAAQTSVPNMLRTNTLFNQYNNQMRY